MNYGREDQGQDGFDLNVEDILREAVAFACVIPTSSRGTSDGPLGIYRSAERASLLMVNTWNRQLGEWRGGADIQREGAPLPLQRYLRRT